jgi:hypothetical protein
MRRGSRIGPKSAKCMKWSAMWATRCRSWPNGAGAHCRGVLVMFAPLGSSGLRARDGSLLLVWANQQSALASPALLLFVRSRRVPDRYSGTRARTNAGARRPAFRARQGRPHHARDTRGTRRPGLSCRSLALHARLTGRRRFTRPSGHSGEMAASEFCGEWKRTSMSSPPEERGCAVMLAWWAWAMAWTMARPSPCPSPEPVRLCPSCWKG